MSQGRSSGRRNNNHMILSETSPPVPEELTYQSKLRSSVYNAVSEDDVQSVVKGIVSRAKEGDRHAISHLFDHVLGGKTPVKIVQNNYYEGASASPAAIDEDEPPASRSERIAKLRERADSGEALFPRTA